MRIERAQPSDLPAIEELLSAAGLPLAGATQAFETGVVARDPAVAVGGSIEFTTACAETAVAMRRTLA